MDALELVVVVALPASIMVGLHYVPGKKLPRPRAYALGVGVIGIILTGLWANNQTVDSRRVVEWFWLAAISAGVATFLCYEWDGRRRTADKIAELEAKVNED